MSHRPDSYAPEQVHSTFDETHGKTIKGTRLQNNPAKNGDVHHDERLTIDFTDGSCLVVVIGSNGGQLHDKFRGFKASELSLSFIPFFREAGESVPKDL